MPACRRGPSWRVVSPSGGSILITSAPRSPSCWAAQGPSTTDVQSRMRTPSSGPGIPSAPQKIASGCAGAPAEADRRRGEQELVAPFLAAGLREALGIRVVDERQTEERDGQVHAHAESGVADRTLVHHVPRDRGDVLLAEPLKTRDLKS